jgi:hypothetical protein
LRQFAAAQAENAESEIRFGFDLRAFSRSRPAVRSVALSETNCSFEIDAKPLFYSATGCRAAA